MLFKKAWSRKRHSRQPGVALHHHQQDGSANFVSYKLQLVSTHNKGLNVIANQTIKEGESLVAYGGGFVDREHLYLIPKHIRPFFFQIADGIWSGHGFDERELGIAERINHSCEPSAGFLGITHVVALRNIERGESITIDYSSLQSEDLEGSSFICACGSRDCRQQVSFRDWGHITKTNPLLPFMQPFIQSRIAPKVSKESSSFSEMRFPTKWRSPNFNGTLQSTLISQSIELINDGTARATLTIPKGEVVFVAGGKIVHQSDLSMTEDSVRPHLRPLTQDLYASPKSSSDVTPSRVARVDDSCSNVEVRLGHIFVATQDIKVGEEIVLHSGRAPVLRIFEAENSDTISASQAPSLALSGGNRFLRQIFDRTISSLRSFIKGAVLEDWMAAPIAFVGSMTATFATALCVAGIAPAFERLFGSTYSPAYIAATSTTAIVLGYASYCLFYWGGMLLKERADLLDEAGTLSKELLKKKWEVLKWDFLWHLPSDGYWVIGMFGVQGGLYATGATDLFWSIVAAQGLSDVYYSLREPFYWRAAKKSAEWRMRRAQPANEAANRDTPQLTVEEKVGNA
ncbi:MAG: hypothetical protein RIS36_1998 [Pseudomonadota bacterium]|jgi:hypothetical protein